MKLYKVADIVDKTHTILEELTPFSKLELLIHCNENGVYPTIVDWYTNYNDFLSILLNEDDIYDIDEYLISRKKWFYVLSSGEVLILNDFKSELEET